MISTTPHRQSAAAGTVRSSLTHRNHCTPGVVKGFRGAERLAHQDQLLRLKLHRPDTAQVSAISTFVTLAITPLCVLYPSGDARHTLHCQETRSQMLDVELSQATTKCKHLHMWQQEDNRGQQVVAVISPLRHLQTTCEVGIPACESHVLSWFDTSAARSAIMGSL